MLSAETFAASINAALDLEVEADKVPVAEALVVALYMVRNPKAVQPTQQEAENYWSGFSPANEAINRLIAVRGGV